MGRRYGLRDDQREKVETLLPGRLSKRCWTGIARGFRGEICRSGLEIAG